MIDRFEENGVFNKIYEVKSKGLFEISIHYWHVNNTLNENTITINKLQILGSNLGGGISCQQCPIGSIRTNLTSNECKFCKKGFTSNKDSKNKIFM